MIIVLKYIITIIRLGISHAFYILHENLFALFLTGRNMALNKTVTSSEISNDYPSSNAVDGRVDNSWNYCLVTPDSTGTDWLTLDLGHQAILTSVKIVSCNNNGLLDFYFMILKATSTWPFFLYKHITIWSSERTSDPKYFIFNDVNI